MTRKLVLLGAVACALAWSREAEPARQEGAKNRLVVHEWGTFTSVVGADGTMLEWKPLIGSDLPTFVYNRATACETPEQWHEEKGLPSFQRMETPVLYFYADEAMDVTVEVGFPKGLITEWYPRARDFRPRLGDGRTPLPVKDGWVRWGRVRIIPQDEIKPRLATEGDANHYYHARETDSAYVRVCPVEQDHQKTQVEKFLFYRGVGNFTLPLEVRTKAGGHVTVSNPTATAFAHIFVITIKADGKGKFQFISRIAAGGSKEVHLDVSENCLSKEMLIRRIGEELEECLTMEGLYRKEAKSMVKTWTDSYFETPGTRVLYLLPEAMTEALLPLKVEPRPAELKRILVARVDVMTPEQTSAVEDLVRRLGSDSVPEREAAEKKLAAVGRFAEPALTEAARATADAEIRARAQKLIARFTVRR
jgi:hypothetical protein